MRRSSTRLHSGGGRGIGAVKLCRAEHRPAGIRPPGLAGLRADGVEGGRPRTLGWGANMRENPPGAPGVAPSREGRTGAVAAGCSGARSASTTRCPPEYAFRHARCRVHPRRAIRVPCAIQSDAPARALQGVLRRDCRTGGGVQAAGLGGLGKPGRHPCKYGRYSGSNIWARISASRSGGIGVRARPRRWASSATATAMRSETLRMERRSG